MADNDINKVKENSDFFANFDEIADELEEKLENESKVPPAKDHGDQDTSSRKEEDEEEELERDRGTEKITEEDQPEDEDIDLNDELLEDDTKKKKKRVKKISKNGKEQLKEQADRHRRAMYARGENDEWPELERTPYGPGAGIVYSSDEQTENEYDRIITERYGTLSSEEEENKEDLSPVRAREEFPTPSEHATRKRPSHVTGYPQNYAEPVNSTTLPDADKDDLWGENELYIGYRSKELGTPAGLINEVREQSTYTVKVSADDYTDMPELNEPEKRRTGGPASKADGGIKVNGRNSGLEPNERTNKKTAPTYGQELKTFVEDSTTHAGSAGKERRKALAHVDPAGQSVSVEKQDFSSTPTRVISQNAEKANLTKSAASLVSGSDNKNPEEEKKRQSQMIARKAVARFKELSSAQRGQIIDAVREYENTAKIDATVGSAGLVNTKRIESERAGKLEEGISSAGTGKIRLSKEDVKQGIDTANDKIRPELSNHEEVLTGERGLKVNGLWRPHEKSNTSQGKGSAADKTPISAGTGKLEATTTVASSIRVNGEDVCQAITPEEALRISRSIEGKGIVSRGAGQKGVVIKRGKKLRISNHGNENAGIMGTTHARTPALSGKRPGILGLNETATGVNSEKGPLVAEQRKAAQSRRNLRIDNGNATEQYYEYSAAENGTIRLSQDGETLLGRGAELAESTKGSAQKGIRIDAENSSRMKNIAGAKASWEAKLSVGRGSRIISAGGVLQAFSSTAKEASNASLKYRNSWGLNNFGKGAQTEESEENATEKVFKPVLKAVAKKAVSVILAGTLAVGAGTVGISWLSNSAGSNAEDIWYPPQAHILSDPKNENSQVMTAYVLANLGVRLNAYQTLANGGSVDTTNKATQNLKQIQINEETLNGSSIGTNNRTLSSLKEFTTSYTYEGNLEFSPTENLPEETGEENKVIYTENRASTHTETLSVDNISVNFEFDDKDGNPIVGTRGYNSDADKLNITATGEAGKILEVAKKHMGGTYLRGGDKWGSGSYDTAVDSSHFIWHVLMEAGVYHGGYHVALDWVSEGRKVSSPEKAQAGDIIIYKHNDGSGHIAIYDGNGSLYHARDSEYGIQHTGEAFNDDWIAIRRFAADGTSITVGATGSNPSIGQMNIQNGRTIFLKSILSMSALGCYYSDPSDIDAYSKYCYDLLDYAVTGWRGAEARYSIVDSGEDIEWGEDGGTATAPGKKLTCSVTVHVCTDMKTLEENDNLFGGAWDVDASKNGDMMAYSYMLLPSLVFDRVFNVRTNMGSSVGLAPGEQVIYNFFASKGLGDVAIAGILANVARESSFDPTVINADSGSSGLFQWLGGRLTGLKNYATRMGKDWTDMQTQLEFAWAEISGDGSVPEATMQWSKALWSQFQTTNDPYEAGSLFGHYWERYGSAAEDDERGRDAQDYYNKIMSGLIGGTAYMQWAIAIAMDDNHGYSQYHRNGPDYDCASLVYYSLMNTGYPIQQYCSYAFTTPGMGSTLRQLGFQEIKIPGSTDFSILQPGDILVNPDSHTEIYVGNGQCVGAHCDENGGIEGNLVGDQDGHEINVQNIWGTWEYAYRPAY